MKQVLVRFRSLCYLSKLLFMLSIIFLIPLVTLIAYPQESHYAYCFFAPTAATILLAFLLDFKDRRFPSKRPPGRQNDVIVVVGVWFYMFFIGGMPFLLADMLDPLRSVFESVSGWTTTGFTMLNVETVPHVFLFYRSWMQFCGGLGFVLLILMFANGTGAMKLFAAEGHPDKLEGNLIGTARLMFFIYAGFTAAGAVLYILCGMPWFDAVNHSMSALSTGGFSTQVQGIAHYNSLSIELVTIVLMLLGGTNFAILALLVKGQFKKLCRIGETKFLFVLIALAVACIGFAGLGTVYSTVGESFRVAVFQSVSALTSTGYSIASYDGWQPAMKMTILIAMIIGGGMGSTAGGMKYSRVHMLAVYFWHNLKKRFYPERAVNECSVYRPQGKQYLTPRIMLTIHHFALVYLGVFFIGSLLLAFGGVPIEDAMLEFGSALGTVGLSTGLTSASASNYILCVQIAGMILARLEVYIVFVFFAAIVRRIFRK
ncbi:MAG: TrkH family potassium uptake protein [Clostridiales bacterium]|nr:TrkH family potassium uptake protein [Clostridiales bacterium]